VLVNVRRWTDRKSMTEAWLPFLRQQEDANCILVGTLYGMDLAGREIAPDRLFLSAEQDGQIHGVLMRTPPYGPTISHFTHPDAAPALAAALYEHTQRAVTMVALESSLALFAAAWETLSGERGERVYDERLHRLDEIVFWPQVPGRMAPAADGHLPLLVSWMDAFQREALGKIAPVNPADGINNRMAGPPEVAGMRVWLDEAGEPVAMAGYGGPTGTSMRIGPVYTPPNRRGFGYATALTAHLTQELLDRGLKSVILFTDVANPQSNRIYQRIGYRPVCDMVQVRFVPASEQQVSRE
jgi:uncharacterized protein